LNVHEVLDDVILLAWKKLTERKITVDRRYAANLPPVEAVADQIKQVLLNLIQNAEEAIAADGGKIEITTAHGDAFVIIKIRDTGCGISPEHVENIFDPFFTTKSAVKGTGLGLSVSYGIVKSHGGDIAVESRPGAGSTFTVALPVKRENLN
jgi:signal transduction histidine kinase